MESAVLKTLIYSDIFDFPLTLREIHRFLIQKKANLRQVEKAVNKLNHESRIKNQGEYYFLSGRRSLVTDRLKKQSVARSYLRKAKIIGQVLKIIPFIKLVGISGGLAMSNVTKKDDIDLFIITKKNSLWISRILILGLLDLLGQRRKKQFSRKEAAGFSLAVSGRIIPEAVLLSASEGSIKQ